MKILYSYVYILYLYNAIIKNECLCVYVLFAGVHRNHLLGESDDDRNLSGISLDT